MYNSLNHIHTCHHFSWMELATVADWLFLKLVETAVSVSKTRTIWIAKQIGAKLQKRGVQRQRLGTNTNEWEKQWHNTGAENETKHEKQMSKKYEIWNMKKKSTGGMVVGLLLRSQKSGSGKKVLQAITVFIAELRYVMCSSCPWGRVWLHLPFPQLLTIMANHNECP